MKLKDYLIKTQKADETLTDRVGRFSEEISYSAKQIWEWLAGRAKPRTEAMDLIHDLTGGKVPHQSWYLK